MVKGNGYTFIDGNYDKISFFVSVLKRGLLQKGSTLRGKNVLPRGANSFLLEETAFYKALCMQVCKQEVTKWQKKYQMYQVTLKNMLYLELCFRHFIVSGLVENYHFRLVMDSG